MILKVRSTSEANRFVLRNRRLLWSRNGLAINGWTSTGRPLACYSLGRLFAVLVEAGILQAIQSQYKEEQIQGSNLNILAPGNETLIDLMDEFSETRTERNIARVACFYEQKPSNVGAIYKGPRLQVSKLVFLQMSLTVYSNSWWMKLQGAWIKANRQRNTLFPEKCQG